MKFLQEILANEELMAKLGLLKIQKSKIDIDRANEDPGPAKKIILEKRRYSAHQKKFFFSISEPKN